MLEDLDIFFDEKEFAVEVRSENPARTFAAIFDAPGATASLGGLELGTTMPTLTTKAENVMGFERRVTTVEVSGVADSFVVVDVKPDGSGLAVVELSP